MAFEINQNDPHTFGMDPLTSEGFQRLKEARIAFAQQPPHGLRVGPTTVSFSKQTLNRLLNPIDRPKPDGLRLYFGLGTNGKLTFVVCAATLPRRNSSDNHDLTHLVLRSTDGIAWHSITPEQARPSLRRFRNQLNLAVSPALAAPPAPVPGTSPPGQGPGNPPPPPHPSPPRLAKGYFLGRKMLLELLFGNRLQLVLFTQAIEARETIGLSITSSLVISDYDIPDFDTLGLVQSPKLPGVSHFATRVASPSLPRPGTTPHHSPTCTRPCPNVCGELGRET